MRFSASRLASLGFLGGGLLLAACDKDSDSTPPALPAKVTIAQPGLYPEGTQYDDNQQHFLVSSQTAGRVGQVDDKGAYKVFADDPQLVSTIGLHLDAARGRLLAAVSDPGYNPDRTSAATKGKLAAVAIFDRATGAKTGYVDLGGLRPNYAGHFANDIAVDGQGNAYVTDSFAPIIYKIDAQGAATVFLENPALAAPAGMFGLNGIVYHPNGYLLVAKSDKGALLKVPLDSPDKFTEVKLLAMGTTALNLSGADGLQLVDNTTLLVACNAQGQVYRLASPDDFTNVRRTGSFATGAVYPTTMARRTGQSSYVLYSNLDALQKQLPPVAQFELTQLAF